MKMNKHPLDALLGAHHSSRYQLSKNSGIPQMTLSNIIKRNVAIESLKIGLLEAIAKECSSTIDEVYRELKEYEKEY